MSMLLFLPYMQMNTSGKFMIEKIKDLKKLLGKLSLKDLGEAKQLIGMQINRHGKNKE